MPALRRLRVNVQVVRLPHVFACDQVTEGGGEAEKRAAGVLPLTGAVAHRSHRGRKRGVLLVQVGLVLVVEPEPERGRRRAGAPRTRRVRARRRRPTRCFLRPALTPPPSLSSTTLPSSFTPRRPHQRLWRRQRRQ